MSTPFYDLASLVVVPSGYKTSKVYAQKPLTTDGQLAFTRSTTATRVNSAGLIEASAVNVPRLDYLNSSCPRLLLEPQRTNLVTYSEQFDNAAYTKTNVSVTANTGVSPDGYTNADTILSTAASPQLLSPVITFGAATNVSVFVKYVSQRFVQLFGGGAFGDFANFDLQNATLGTSGASTANAKIENYGNGWLRISATFSGFAGGTTARLGFTSASNAGWNSLDTAFNKSVLAYGFQAEVASYATSYIPTLGAAVTRGADAASKNPANAFFGTNAGTIFVEFDSVGFDPSQGNYVFDFAAGADTTNRILVYFSPSDNTLRLFYATTAGVTAQQVFAVTMSAIKKIAVKWDASSIKMFYNGTATSSFAFGATAPNDLTLFARYTDTEPLAAKSAQVLTFPTTLTDAQCIELTTL